mmetsp:Transcript_17566/g.21535  ORF Transcript_17566/g.21535 Transcript_17566/m.21535 type:complete len:93 (+) Transcript_17566:374-652(+)
MPITGGFPGSTECDPAEVCAPAAETGSFSNDNSDALIEHYGRADGGARVDIDSEGGGGLGLEPQAHEPGGGRGRAIRVRVGEWLFHCIHAAL